MTWIKGWMLDEIRLDKRLENLKEKTDRLDEDCQMLLSYLQGVNEGNNEIVRLQGMLIAIRSSLNFASAEIQRALLALKE